LKRVDPRFALRSILQTIAIVAIASVIAFALKSERGEVAGALVFVLGITLAGAVAGLMAGILAAMAAFLLYNFYFAEPVLTFRLTTGSDVTPLIIFNLCALVAGVLAGRLKDRARAADAANERLSSLFQTSRALQSALSRREIAATLEREAAAAGIAVRLVGTDEAALSELDEAARDCARKALAQRDAVVRAQGWCAYGLEGRDGVTGLMLLRAGDADRSEPAFLAALANLGALAIERSALSDRIATQTANARTEELKSALLSSVSHDLRTPLATISASASSLLAYGDRLEGNVSTAMLSGIVEECDRLDRYTGNLLELTRIEAGPSQAAWQLLSVSDMLSAVLRRVRPRLEDRRIERKDPAADLLVRADAGLFELALTNVVENAALYSPNGSRIQIASWREGDGCWIEVADEGIGIAPDELTHVFERFYRGKDGRAHRSGSGLGLAIAKGFVEALDGAIEAAVPGIGTRGTAIRIRLPLGALPAEPSA
jgi:two-component system, OmpR family, sensor histidine kinase KdpD